MASVGKWVESERGLELLREGEPEYEAAQEEERELQEEEE
jgi:hypothetical protein